MVVCPAFADSISEGDLRWEKAVGDTVSEDEVLFLKDNCGVSSKSKREGPLRN